MKKDIKLRIVGNSNKNKFVVEKKYFNLFWYSFDFHNKDSDTTLIGLIMSISLFIAVGALGLTFIVKIFNMLDHSFTCCWKTSFIVLESIFIILLLIDNKIIFKTYKDAEDYIKEEIKNGNTDITEFNWNGDNITIEKK
jgi:hypothetical protein